MKKLISGNQAILQGALKAGANYFAGYPITPASEIMHGLSDYISKLNNPDPLTNPRITFLQTEDEIAAIHSIIGASLAGKKAFTSTSGPGFSLMQEGLGLAFSFEAPIVVINSMRQGPSTGMPTLPGQGDIIQTQYGTHGDYQSIVYYPNSVRECYTYTIKSFNTAQEVQSPVILFSDAFISHLSEMTNLDYEEEILEIQNTPLAMSDKTRYFSGLITGEDGMPDTKNRESYKKWIKKRLKKIDKVAKKHEYYEFYGKIDAENLIIAFGIVSRLIYELVDQNPKKYALFRPIRLFPVLTDILQKFARNKERIVVTEMNEGQYAKILRSELCLDNIENLTVGEYNKLNSQTILNKLED